MNKTKIMFSNYKSAEDLIYKSKSSDIGMKLFSILFYKIIFYKYKKNFNLIKSKTTKI